MSEKEPNHNEEPEILLDEVRKEKGEEAEPQEAPEAKAEAAEETSAEELVKAAVREQEERTEILNRLAAKEIDVDTAIEALNQLKGGR